ncbi:peptide ABC transporter [Actinoplanes sp. OR16]|uniref:ABC transporter substrate-binding protein n=1 Tax=Actinoplanes sp. OR16 TaxID=946334 RepID=UPI000F6DAFE8|nr:ABC transporter substrate-binding protein [Actinoplanes sp. OR16]BBH69071.1 peptide ABC transporter [Actinoplanes sp. OR16]
MSFRSKRLALTTLGITAILTAAAGCTTAGTTTTNGSDAGSIVFGFAVGTLDPVLADQTQNSVPDNALYDTLVEYTRDGKLQPRVATKWTLAPDATSVTFTLRDDVTFADGSKLTAADVVYTLERTKRVGTGVASLINDYRSATAISDTEIKIDLVRPNAIFPGALSKIFILDADLVKQHEGTDNAQSWLAANAAGSGAYTLTSIRQGTEIRLQQRPEYWAKQDGRPAQIVLANVTDGSTARNGLLAGQYDAAIQSRDDAATFAGNPGFRVVERQSAAQNYFFINTKSPKLADVRVRRAVALAFDYQGFVTNVEGGSSKVATGPLPAALGCRPRLPASAQNLDEAKKLLAEAGVSGLSLVAEYQTWNPAHIQAATLLKSNLADIGVKLDLKQITYPAYIAQLAKPETTPDFFYMSDFPLYPDAGTILARTYDSKMIGRGSNYGNYADAEVDALITKALATTDETARCALYEQAQTKIAAAQVSINVSNPTDTLVVRTGFTGLGDSDSHDMVNLLDIRTAG